MTAARQWLGSAAFTLYMFLSVALYACLLLPTLVLPRRMVYAAAAAWARSVLFMLRWLCRLDYIVEGREHLPATSSVVLVKHSSAWETLAQLRIFPPQTWRRSVGRSVLRWRAGPESDRRPALRP